MGKLIINETDYIHIIPVQREDFFDSLGVKKNNNNYSLPFTDKNFSCMAYLDEVLESNIHGLSFFSGAGGLDIGAQMANIKVISSLDFEKDAVETMRANPFFSHTYHFQEDIRNIKSRDFSTILNKNNPEKLVLLGRVLKIWVKKKSYYLVLYK